MFESFLGKIFIIISAIASLLSPVYIDVKENLGTAIPTPIASFTTSLSSKITSTDTSMTLVSTSTDDGTSLTNGKIYGFVIDANTADEEFVVGTASSSNIVSMTRGVSVTTGNTNVSALQKSHRRGASVKISDAPVLLVLARIINGDETFPNILKYDNPKTFTASSSLVDKNYTDNLVAAGVPDGNYSTFGGYVLATTSQVIAGTATSTATRYLVLPSELANTTSSAKNIIPVTKTNGKLSQGFLDLTEGYTFSGGLTSSATTTLSSTTTISGELTISNQDTDFDLAINGQATGDLLYATSSSAYDNLAIGTAGRFLKATSSAIEWGALRYTGNNTTLYGTSTTNLVTVATSTIPANLIGANGTLHLYISGNAGGLSGAETATFDIKFGGTSICSQVITSNAAYMVNGYIVNRNATNSQVVNFFVRNGTTPLNCSVTSAVDTTVNQNIIITAQKSAAAGSGQPYIDFYVIEI